jgi:dextranase
MKFIDFYPKQGSFKVGEILRFETEFETDSPTVLSFLVSFIKGDELVGQKCMEIQAEAGQQCFAFDWCSENNQPEAFLVRLVMLDAKGNEVDRIYTAVDIQVEWTDFPRYGFLSDFQPGRDDIEGVMRTLGKYHVNGVQFYDWQYRHDQLVAPTEEYIDPLKRQLSLKTVLQLIEACHQHGIAAMPYLAVYGASIDFWREHQDWGMYDAEGKPLTFEDFLGIMDPTAGGAWIQHLGRECGWVLEKLPFDGLHVDQYGEPKKAFTADGVEIDIPKAFSDFTTMLKTCYPQAVVAFNSVGNWPVESLAAADVDFVYIEIWPPDTAFTDLHKIVSNARQISRNKPVVIALYIPAAHDNTLRLANAVIMSAGGTRIEIGEHGRLLSDPYFPKHEEMTSELACTLRSYLDFAVAYQSLLGPQAEEVPFESVLFPENLIGIMRRNGRQLALNLINLTGLDDPRWNEAQKAPEAQTDLHIRIKCDELVTGVKVASPDADPELYILDFEQIDGILSFRLPSLAFWTMTVIEI